MNRTPGPWFRGENTKGDDIEKVWSLNEDEVARIFGDTLEKVAGNACLIAAAPELLVACELAISILRCIRDEHPDVWDEIVTPAICEEWDTIKYAISKARGDNQ